MISQDIEKISLLEESRRMGHDINQFHQSQLSEVNYMSMVSKTAERVVEEIPQGKTADILEIGAGSGIFSSKLIEKLAEYNKAFNLNITEPDSDLIVFCRNYLATKHYDIGKDQKVQFMQLRAEDINSLKRKYDIIASSEVFHHLPYENKLTTSRRLLHRLQGEGKMIIGDNFVPNKYNYRYEGNLMEDRRVLAPTVALYLEEFWNRLFNGKLPETFKKSVEQQKEGIIECKTSLPHLIDILGEVGGVIDKIDPLNDNINEDGGYAVLTISKKTFPKFLEYI